MFFHSQTFLYLFLPLVLAGYYVAPAVLRLPPSVTRTLLNVFLFAASVFFYAWGEKDHAVVLLAMLVVNHALARMIAASQARGGTGKAPLVAAVVFDLGVLGYFKYAGFLVRNLAAGSEALGGPTFTLADPHLPIGVSFFTFQAISYAVDVYRKEVPAQQSFLQYGLYVFLFPHLIAGPIVRYRDIAGQLAGRSPSLEMFASGVRRFQIGLAKKVLLADTLARTADMVFALPGHELTPSAAWLGAVCYALQIYFDFGGYSDMAIGLGRMFGFTFLENFDHPYAAASVTDFWRRWHISLSTWFRDYVYIPLGGNRGGRWKTYRNLLVVFALCGVWHGASWAFLVWGLWHGAFLILERAGLGGLLSKCPAAVRHGYALAAVFGGWVIFRAETLPQAGTILAAMAGFAGGSYTALDFATNSMWAALAVGAVVSLPVGPWLAARRPAWGDLVAAPALAGLMVLTAAALAGNTYSAFIYFRF